MCAAVTGLRRPPEGLTDSKLLTPRRRAELAPVLRSWVTAYALGEASPQEIDDLGMTAALRLAAVRALDGLPVRPDAVILDGKHDYLGAPWKVRTVVRAGSSEGAPRHSPSGPDEELCGGISNSPWPTGRRQRAITAADGNQPE
ncbi:Ribonuclease HII [Streptomyces griseus]